MPTTSKKYNRYTLNLTIRNYNKARTRSIMAVFSKRIKKLSSGWLMGNLVKSGTHLFFKKKMQPMLLFYIGISNGNDTNDGAPFDYASPFNGNILTTPCATNVHLSGCGFR